MCTASTLPYGGGLPDRDPLDRDPSTQRSSPGQRPPRLSLPWTAPPGQRPFWTETPLAGQRSLGQRPHLDRDPSGQRPPWLDRDPLDRDPTWTETPLDRDPPGQRPPCGQTNTCENIIFSQLRLWAVKMCPFFEILQPKKQWDIPLGNLVHSVCCVFKEMSVSEVRLLDEAVLCLPCLYRVALNNHWD